MTLIGPIKTRPVKVATGGLHSAPKPPKMPSEQEQLEHRTGRKGQNNPRR